MSNHPTPAQCYQCANFFHEYEDYDVGLPEVVACGAAFTEGNSDEQTELFESILFQLAHLNNCPQRAEKSKQEGKRVSILDLKP